MRVATSQADFAVPPKDGTPKTDTAACGTPAERALAQANPNDDLGRFILPLMAGRRVLDIGSINHSFFGTAARRRHSSFFRIETVASYVLGIDAAAPQVALAREHGHNILHRNAETFVAKEAFDVVHAGDLIEHLSNPGLFLECSHKNLEPGGLLILITPNTYSLSSAWDALIHFTNDPPVNIQHTCYHSPTTLNQLVFRYGFELVSMTMIEIEQHNHTLGQRLASGANQAITWMFPRFKGTIAAVYRKAEKPRPVVS